MREMIVDRLKKIYKDNINSFYVPGHKHGRLIDEYLLGVKLENLDFTEIDGTDNLHDAKDIIASAQNFASDYYESDASYFMVNGSTSGILSGISSIGRHGDKILTTRDCHKSVYNAMTINDYQGVYIDVNYDYEFDLSLGPNYYDYQKKISSSKDIKAVVLTYPTYNGICYDIKKFIDLAHGHKIAVIVDEAHGAHFKISDILPKSALDYGADIVVQSIHKMLPAFTQSSIIHFKSNIINKEDLEHYLKIYQSSSPSYMLLASIDIAIDIAYRKGEDLLNIYNENLKSFYKNIDYSYYKNVNQIISKKHKLLVDPFKINIAINKSNTKLMDLESFLRSNHMVQCEYSNRKVSLFVSSIATKDLDLQLLNRGLDDFKNMQNIKEGKNKSQEDKFEKDIDDLEINYSGQYKKTLYEALKSNRERVDIENSIGKISADMITPYPPGIPYILPGELITEEKVNMIKKFIKYSIQIEGLEKNGERNLINIILE